MKKRIIIISGWAALIVGASVLLGFAEFERNNTICKSVDIVISGKGGNYFITMDELQKLISKDQGKLAGKLMSNINLLNIEHELQNNPYIMNARVFATLDGNIKIKITQKTPIARIMNSDDDSYYIDSAGNFMPLSDNCTAHVLIVNGFINNSYSQNYKNNAKKMESDTSVHSLLPSIYRIASYVYNDAFWAAQITQVYIDSTKEFILIPGAGGQRILLGDTSSLNQKFEKLFALCKDGFNYNGKWSEYSTINLKFKNQVICTKN